MIPGVCPDCGARRALADFAADAETRRALAAALDVPADLARLVVPYLSLLAPRQRSMQATRLARLLEEFAALVTAGTVTRERETRPAPVAAWRAGLETVLEQAERPGALALPLAGHAYLAEVVWRQAGQAGAAHAARAQPQHPSHRQFVPADVAPAARQALAQGPRPVAERLAALDAIGQLRRHIGGAPAAEE